ncbi:hypothetical protein [Ornithinimicrobium flavum]|uniref:hypothetical protein n=1 Tax=Ornithinimicrobium flavum TaxID=1288636 RepID=UPI00106FB3FA|nr:hypothetical protein [Ornithinimicrobium flavum]
MDEDLLTEALLDAVTVGAKLHGMPVDTATLAGQFHPDGAPIHDELVPAFAEADMEGLFVKWARRISLAFGSLCVRLPGRGDRGGLRLVSVSLATRGQS